MPVRIIRHSPVHWMITTIPASSSSRLSSILTINKVKQGAVPGNRGCFLRLEREMAILNAEKMNVYDG